MRPFEIVELLEASRGLWGTMMISMLQIAPPEVISESLSGNPLVALAFMFGAGVMTSLAYPSRATPEGALAAR